MSEQTDSTHPQNPLPAGFDPFNNRFSRDVRNSLSEALVQALMTTDPSGYRQAADGWLGQNPDDAHIAYIRNRLSRYDRAFARIMKEGIEDSRSQSLILWNNQLFFEVHEHLEQIWHQTAGGEHQALKGLIQAAGVYVHLEAGNQAAADRLAVKSIERLETHSAYLQFIDNLSLLVDKLRSLDSAPPRLVSRHGALST